jgi:methylphosphotriester-DNA--protein-cysteine methyltransferase
MLPGRRAQIWRYSPQYRRPRHFHSESELNLVVSGTATFGTGTTIIGAAAGDLLHWPPGCDHELLHASPDFDLFVFALTPELCDRVLVHQAALALSGPLQVRLPESTTSALHARLAVPAISAEASVAEEYLASLWQDAHRSRMTAPRRETLGRRVLRSLLQQPELDRSERARLMHAHPSELSRSFHREFGLTLANYRTRLRLLRFIELVDTGRSRLLSAALAAGFGSYSQCHRAFSVTFGCTPRAFFQSHVRHDMAEAFEPFDTIVDPALEPQTSLSAPAEKDTKR